MAIKKSFKSIKNHLPLMIIIYPTETCYGIGCSAYDEKSIKKIYEIKKREKNKPLITLVDSIENFQKICKASPKAIEYAKKYWPGPLTIVQPKRNPKILKGFNSIGARVSSNKWANRLIKMLGAPIISTSANLSGEPPAYSLKEMPQEILKKADLIIDKGELKKNPPSTVISFNDDKLIMLRQGKLKIK